MYINNHNKKSHPFIDIGDTLDSKLYNVYVHAITQRAWPFVLIITVHFPKEMSPTFFRDNLMKLYESFYWLLKNVILNFGHQNWCYKLA